MTDVLKLQIGDKDVRFKSPGFLYFHLAEKEYCRIKREAFEYSLKMLSALPAPLANPAILEAYRDFIGTCLVLPDEVNAWLASASGKLFGFSLLMRAVDKAASDEDVRAAYSQITKPQFDELDGYFADGFGIHGPEKTVTEKPEPTKADAA